MWLNKLHVLALEPLALDEFLSYEEQSVKNLDNKVCNTRRRDIIMCKVLWENPND